MPATEIQLISLEDNANSGRFIYCTGITIRNTEETFLIRLAQCCSSYLLQWSKGTLYFIQLGSRQTKKSDNNPDIIQTSVFSTVFEEGELEP